MCEAGYPAPVAAMRELAVRTLAIEVTGTVADVRPYLEADNGTTR